MVRLGGRDHAIFDAFFLYVAPRTVSNADDAHVTAGRRSKEALLLEYMTDTEAYFALCLANLIDSPQ